MKPPPVLNGRYDLGALLGQGGMGVVHRTIDRQHLERGLAVKCIRADAVSESSLSLFKAEFKQIALDLYDASDAAPYVRFVRRALESLA